MTRELCFTVDVDRDVNERIPGRTDAVSPNTGGKARFTSSEAGVNMVLELLDSIGAKATFFAEARTLRNIDVHFGKNEVAMHGLDHEDMTGEVSGITLTDDEMRNIMRTSADTIRDVTGSSPKGFRAPYMRIDERIVNILPEFGIRYDSSMYADLGSSMRPYRLNSGITEIPVPVRVDGNGKRMAAYLWPMHEGIRKFSEYIEMANVMEDGVFVIATHSWHMTESRSDGIFDNARREKNLRDVREILTSLLDDGFKMARMSDVGV
ncbi:MAG: polysaccharide deacetylase family protein [Methanomassiliicoccaceae archaeon]|nr:polysaccharide deacetylase family protein [Methanomassiliicoccaceae archaeon]